MLSKDVPAGSMVQDLKRGSAVPRGIWSKTIMPCSSHCQWLAIFMSLFFLLTRPRGLVGIGVAMHGAPSEVWIIPAAGLNWGCHHPCHRKAPSLTFFPHQLSKALPPGLAPLLSELGELRCPCLRLDSCATLGLGKFTKSLFAGCLLRCLVVGQQATKAFCTASNLRAALQRRLWWRRYSQARRSARPTRQPSFRRRNLGSR